MRWQIQQAKQRFSELVRLAEDDEPQVVTRHGVDVVVVVAVDCYRRMSATGPDFKQFLADAPDLDALDVQRDSQPARRIELDRNPTVP